MHSISIVKSINTVYSKLSPSEINCILRILQVLRKKLYVNSTRRLVARCLQDDRVPQWIEKERPKFTRALFILEKACQTPYSNSEMLHTQGSSRFLFLLCKSSIIADIVNNTVKKSVICMCIKCTRPPPNLYLSGIPNYPLSTQSH